jgi:hypothetical protein
MVSDLSQSAALQTLRRIMHPFFALSIRFTHFSGSNFLFLLHGRACRKIASTSSIRKGDPLRFPSVLRTGDQLTRSLPSDRDAARFAWQICWYWPN